MPKTKHVTFFRKRLSGKRVKTCFLLTVFSKSRVLLKTFQSCFKQSTAVAAKKGACCKNRRFVKHSGWFLTWRNGVFLFRCFVGCLVCFGWLCGVCLFFIAFEFLWFGVLFFVCLVKLHNICFSTVFAFWGVLFFFIWVWKLLGEVGPKEHHHT